MCGIIYYLHIVWYKPEVLSSALLLIITAKSLNPLQRFIYLYPNAHLPNKKKSNILNCLQKFFLIQLGRMPR